MSFDNHAYATAIAPKCTALLSIMGSLFIITDIVKSKEKLGRTYSRILLVMSTYDLLTSIAQGMSTWPIPKGSGRPFASGTTFTCSFQGFFTQLGVGAPMYNCSLSFYYLIVIAFAYSEDRVKQIEWFMHGIPLLFSISTAAAGLPLKLYNNAYLWCWIAALPGNCKDGSAPGGDGPTCDRGLHSWIYRWAIYYGPIWGCVIIITLNMAVVSYLVWAKERASLRFRFGHPRSGTTSSAPSHASDGGRSYANSSVVSSVVSADDSDFMDGNPNRIKAKAHKLAQYIAKKRMKKEKQKQRQGLASQVFWQAFYYVIGFYITWICPTAVRMLQTIKQPVPNWLILLMSMLLPFQGFMNFLVYVRPRVVQYRNRHPDKGCGNAIARAIRRTVQIVYVPESRAFHETEIQDIEALDPCYALQVEKEEEERQRRSVENNLGRESKSKRGSGDIMDISAGEISFHRASEESGTIEKAPLFRDSLDQNRLDQHRLDELKLLGQDDPSFHSGQPSKMDFSLEMDDSSKRSKGSKDSNSVRSGEPNNRNGSGNNNNNNNVSYRSEESGPPTELWNRPGSPQPPREASKPIMMEELEPEQDGDEAPNGDDEAVEVVAPVETAPESESPNQQATSDEDGNDGKEIQPMILESVAEEDPNPEVSGEDPNPEVSGEDPNPEVSGEDPNPEVSGEDPDPESSWEDRKWPESSAEI